MTDQRAAEAYQAGRTAKLTGKTFAANPYLASMMASDASDDQKRGVLAQLRAWDHGWNSEQPWRE